MPATIASCGPSIISHQVLNDDDEVTIISFGSNARVELPKLRMTPDGKQRARDVINSLATNGQASTSRLFNFISIPWFYVLNLHAGSTNLIDAMQMSLKVPAALCLIVTLPCPVSHCHSPP